MDPNCIWDVPPIPEAGEDDPVILFQAVGAALTSWEYLESVLALLFGTMLGLETVSLSAQRAYGSIAAFTGRLDLLKGAASGYFEQHPDAKHEATFDALGKTLRKAAGRRNDIAHGTVTLYPRHAPARECVGYLLIPSSYSVIKNDAHWKPKYAYSAATIDRFRLQFAELVAPTADILVDIMGKHQAQRAGRIPPSTPKKGSLTDLRAQLRISIPSSE